MTKKSKNASKLVLKVRLYCSSKLQYYAKMRQCARSKFYLLLFDFFGDCCCCRRWQLDFLPFDFCGPLLHEIESVYRKGWRCVNCYNGKISRLRNYNNAISVFLSLTLSFSFASNIFFELTVAHKSYKCAYIYVFVRYSSLQSGFELTAKSNIFRYKVARILTHTVGIIWHTIEREIDNNYFSVLVVYWIFWALNFIK